MAWLAGLAVDVETWPWRIALLFVALVLAAGGVGVLLMQWSHEQRAAQVWLDRLSSLDYREVVADNVADELVALGKRHPWRGSLRSVREAFFQKCERLQELEHARAALEIRSRRSAAEQERVAAILANLTEPILVVDQYDQLVLANTSAQKLFGIDAESAADRPVAQVLRCEKLLELVGEMRIRKGAARRTVEVELPVPEGGSRWYSMTAKNISEAGDRGEQPSVTQLVVVVLRDISGQKVAQQRHAEFVASVSHEMKTPLAGIKAYVELLVDGDAEDETTREEFLNVINSQADRLQRLIDNLLSLARIEAGATKVNKRNHSLNELLEEAFNVMEPAAQRKHITFVGELSPMYLGVLADRDMMLQVAINLLSNAVKYTPEAGRVTLRSRLVDQEVQFEVEDSGVGLSEEDRQRVFEKFYRVKKDSDMAPGTGLGLALVKHIVQDVHGGDLRVTSELGLGSTFQVTLASAGRRNSTGERSTVHKQQEPEHDRQADPAVRR